jgi:hypothetical protein
MFLSARGSTIPDPFFQGHNRYKSIQSIDGSDYYTIVYWLKLSCNLLSVHFVNYGIWILMLSQVNVQ